MFTRSRLSPPTISKASLAAAVVLSLLLLVENVRSFAPSRFFRPSHSSKLNGANEDFFPRPTEPAGIVPVDDSNYRQLFRGEKFLLLDACAKWCGPCKLIEPTLEQFAEDWKDSLVVGKFDVEDIEGSRDLKVELLLKGVMPKALPSLILVHKTEVLETWKGVIRPDELQGMLERHIAVVDNNAGASRREPTPVSEAVEKRAASQPSFRGISLISWEENMPLSGARSGGAI